MPMPTLAPSTALIPAAVTLTRTQAASRLELNPAGVDKLMRAGILSSPIEVAEVELLTGRERLQVAAGALTVLRTDARREADLAKYPTDLRRWMGFHVEHSNKDLEAASLRWWRSDVTKVLDNELFAVTVATFPVALYRIDELVDSFIWDSEDTPRHHYRGSLIARVHPGMSVTYASEIPDNLRSMAEQIMGSRVVVSSGGPIGYLEP